MKLDTELEMGGGGALDVRISTQNFSLTFQVHNHVLAPWTRHGLIPIITSGRKKHDVATALRHF